jgi:hypothetical protein
MNTTIQHKRDLNRKRRNRRSNIVAEPIDKTLWQAKSQSDGRSSHMIYWSRKNRRWECDCMGFVMRQFCSHADHVTIETKKGKLNPR